MFAVGSPRTNETLRYLGSRLVTTVLIVIGAMLLLFTLTAVVPGDPATAPEWTSSRGVPSPG